MPDAGWFDRPRGFAISHLAGVAALGLIAGLLLAGANGTAPISNAEITDLAVVTRQNMASPDKVMFGPYVCGDSCEGHAAGWTWAQKHRPRSVGDCSGSRSTSFLEGCMFYLQVRGYERDEQ